MKRTNYFINCLKLSFLIAISLISYDIFAESYEAIVRAVVGNHTRALDRANMYGKPLDGSDLTNWLGVFKEVGNFVAENSKKNKKQLMDFFTNIKAANDDLINGIKVVYGTKGNVALANQHKKIFSSIEQNMQTLENNLQWVGSKDVNENEAIKLLAILAKYVKVTARKAEKDI